METESKVAWYFLPSPGQTATHTAGPAVTIQSLGHKPQSSRTGLPPWPTAPYLDSLAVWDPTVHGDLGSRLAPVAAAAGCGAGAS